MSWLNYTDEKFIEVIANSDRKELGTELHAFACSRIKLAMKYRGKTNIRKDVVSYLYSKYIDDFDGRVNRSDYEKKKGWHLIEKLDLLPEPVWDCLVAHINDAIAYRMEPEVILYYSDAFYGTTDAISFDKNVLRIHDLKTGDVAAHMQQLEGYAALFCLEYKIKPGEIKTELRIYQGLDVLIEEASADIIAPIMDKIVHLNKIRNKE